MKSKEDLHNLILNKIKSFASNSQINLQSESTQLMITDELTEEIDKHMQDLIETIVVGQAEEAFNNFIDNNELPK